MSKQSSTPDHKKNDATKPIVQQDNGNLQTAVTPFPTLQRAVHKPRTIMAFLTKIL